VTNAPRDRTVPGRTTGSKTSMVNIPARSIGERETLIQIIGVIATASLVNSNKFVLGQVTFPAKSAALTFLHNACTFFWIRLSSNCAGVKPRDVHWGWLLCITGLGSLSVVASNLLLQLTSVKFHQLSKLTAMPAGAVLDFYLYGKKRSWKDFVGLASVTYGIYVTSRDETSVSFHSAGIALIFIAGYLTNAVLVRHLCTLHQISSTEFLYLCVPWGLFSSLVLFLIVLSFEQKTSGAEINFEHNPVGASLSVLVNLLLAVAVQWLSMWAASKSTTMIYAIIGQAKTAATIILGVFLFQDSLSPRGACGLSMCLSASLTLAAREAFEKEGYLQRENGVSSVGTRLVAIFLVATLLMDTLKIGGNPMTFRAAPGNQIVSEQYLHQVSFQGADDFQSVVAPDIDERARSARIDSLKSAFRQAGHGFFDVDWNSVLADGVENAQQWDFRFVCITDVDRGHISMVLNSWITLIPFCPHFIAVATEPDVLPYLKELGMPHTFSQKLYEEVKKEVQDGSTPAYLANAMRFKAELTLQLLDTGIPCLFSDADVAHISSMPAILFGLRRSHVPVDIFVSAFFGSETEGQWSKFLSPEVKLSFMSNNGVIMYWPSTSSISFINGTLSDRKEEGWTQINLVKQQARGTYHRLTDHRLPLYLGQGDYNTTIIVTTAIYSSIADDCIKTPAGCLHYHAVGQGGSNRNFSHDKQIEHAKSRIDALKKWGVWMLREDWTKVPKVTPFRKYLASLAS